MTTWWHYDPFIVIFTKKIGWDQDIFYLMCLQAVRPIFLAPAVLEVLTRLHLAQTPWLPLETYTLQCTSQGLSIARYFGPHLDQGSLQKLYQCRKGWLVDFQFQRAVHPKFKLSMSCLAVYDCITFTSASFLPYSPRVLTWSVSNTFQTFSNIGYTNASRTIAQGGYSPPS